jgi:hypothetical protein
MPQASRAALPGGARAARAQQAAELLPSSTAQLPAEPEQLIGRRLAVPLAYWDEHADSSLIFKATITDVRGAADDECDDEDELVVDLELDEDAVAEACEIADRMFAWIFYQELADRDEFGTEELCVALLDDESDEPLWPMQSAAAAAAAAARASGAGAAEQDAHGQARSQPRPAMKRRWQYSEIDVDAGELPPTAVPRPQHTWAGIRDRALLAKGAEVEAIDTFLKAFPREAVRLIFEETVRYAEQQGFDWCKKGVGGPLTEGDVRAAHAHARAPGALLAPSAELV